MSEKESGAVRVGYGRYDWHFQPRQPRLVEALSITIDAMERLPAECLDLAMTWLCPLPYPWCPPSAAIEHTPNVEAFALIRRHLAGLSA